MREYKNTGVLLASGCATAKALADKDNKLAEKTFKETTVRFEQQYSNAEHRRWFMAMSKGAPYEYLENTISSEDMYAADVHIYELEVMLFALQCKVGLQPARPSLILSPTLHSKRRRLENVRRELRKIQDRLSFEDRQAVQNAPSWKVGSVIY